MSTKYVEIPYNVKPEWKMKKAGYVFCNCHIDKTNIKDSVCFTWNSEYGHRDQIATHIHYTKKEYNAICEEEKNKGYHNIIGAIGFCILISLIFFLFMYFLDSIDKD